MSNILAGKVVVVTGASSGLGRATAIAATRHGAKTVLVADLVDTPREGGEPTLDAIAAIGGHAQFVPTDVSKRADVDALVKAARSYGGVDIMVANAGVTAASDRVDVTEEDFDRLIAVNLKGVLFSAQAAAVQMRELGKAGSIVITGSMGGINGSALTVGYSTTKGGVVLMAKSLADALGPDGIRVNAVCPGVIDTHLLHTTPGVAEAVEGFRLRTPLRRLGRPSEVGDAIVWLGSDLASFITGTSLLVDGGLLSVI
ncbi:SDR family NAD(P)-dependent oxidoreductase [Kribbella sp. NPDC058245]|uniref:SDR family NAD(P)-dependent oxidoreductase n=1 Tax=Kribbella sp. NPDC058245 TaxID=3346399 RepID=UPI0036EB97A9